MKNQRGFTLIELLVVIAIIGILSAVVLASLGTARSKGNDAGVKSNLDTVATQSSIFLSNNNNMFGVFDNGSGAPATCPTPDTSGTTIFQDSNVSSAIAAALKDSGGDGATYCVSTDTAFAAAVSRPEGSPSTYWCVDNTGVHCGVNSADLTGAACGACDSTQ